LVAISQCLFHSAREQNIYRRQFLLWMLVLALVRVMAIAHDHALHHH
jgi:predicted nucleic acid-binding Zn ribbon protein